MGRTVTTLSGQKIKQFHRNQLPSPVRVVDASLVSASSVTYVDLENNNLTLDELEKVNPNVALLNLSNNPLGSSQIPNFQRLRSLHMDNCKLKSLTGFPFLPNLRILSLANNRLSTLKGIQVAPKLRSVNISGNTTNFDIHMVLTALGSVFITTFNGTEVTKEQFIQAFSMSPIVGYSLRCGRDPSPCDSYQNELQKSRDFLVGDLAQIASADKQTLVITEAGAEESQIVCPFETKSVRWYMNTMPEKGSEWSLIKTKKPRILPVEMAIRLHNIKCEFDLNGKTYSIYTDEPVGRNMKELCLPFPIQPVIAGIPVEGSMITLLPFPLPTKIAWIQNEKTIALDVNTIIVSGNEVGDSIACLLQPQAPNFVDVGFSTIFVATEKVAPVLPVIGDMAFPDEICEGEEIQFHRECFPDREGDSQILVERALSPSAEWVPVANLQVDNLTYTPTADDVDHYLRVMYIPMTTSGIVGKTVYIYSQTKVMPTMPTFKNAVIGGVPKVNHTLVALADYSGGVKGHCTYDWYFSKHVIKKDHGVTSRLQKVATNQQFFVPDTHMAEGYLAVVMVPVRNDDVIGEPVFCVLGEKLGLEDPPKKFDLPSEVIVGEKIKFPQEVDILISSTSGFCGFDFFKTSTYFKPRTKHIGHIVKIVNESVDMIIGEVRQATPRIMDVTLVCDDWDLGSPVTLSVTHRNVKPDGLTITWIRTNGPYRKVIGLDVPEYTLCYKDAGYRIQAIVTAIDDKGNKLEPVFSNFSPVIKTAHVIEPTIVGTLEENGVITVSCTKGVESVIWYQTDSKSKYFKIGEGLEYGLRNEDVGKFIRAVISMRNGQTLVTTTKSTVASSEPAVDLLPGGEIKEGDLIVPKKVWHGGAEGASIIRWYRETYDGWEFILEAPQYQTTSDDVDCVIRLIYTPIRCDGERGDDKQIEYGPVNPAKPKVENVRVIQNDRGLIEATGKYTGGIEGMSFIIWRVYHDGVPENIGKTMEKEILPDEKMSGQTVDAIYVPVRSDGLAGAPVESSNKMFVEPLPSVISAELLVKRGKVKVGNPMRCNAKVSSGAKAQFQWHHGDGNAWEIIVGADKVEYVPTASDVGFMILCSVTAVDSRGWVSSPYSAMASVHVEPADAHIKLDEKLDLARIYNGVTLSTELTKSDQLRKAKLTWQRSDGKDWVNIVQSDTYHTSVLDIGHRLRAITAKGVTSNATEEVQLEPILGSYVRAIVKSKSVKFVGQSKLGAVVWDVAISPDGITMENKKGNKKVAKWNTIRAEAVENTADEFMLWMDRASKFTLIPTLVDKRLQGLVGSNARDMLVLVINGIKEADQSGR